MRFTSLGSGSEGNALLVETRDGHSVRQVLIDCGFAPREALRRLAAVGCSAAALSAILVTHEHGDHIGGVFKLAAEYGVPVHLTHGTLRASGARAHVLPPSLLRIVDPEAPFELDSFAIEAVAVPHDAAEPVQYLIDDGRVRLAVLTDLGHGSAHVLRSLNALDAIVLECNHDAEMLQANPRYPPMLRRRIAGPWGHLENAQAAEILAGIDRSRLRRIAAAHLSQQNNRPELARAALATAADAHIEDVLVADQYAGLSWVEI